MLALMLLLARLPMVWLESSVRTLLPLTRTAPLSDMEASPLSLSQPWFSKMVLPV